MADKIHFAELTEGRVKSRLVGTLVPGRLLQPEGLGSLPRSVLSSAVLQTL